MDQYIEDSLIEISRVERENLLLLVEMSSEPFGLMARDTVEEQSPNTVKFSKPFIKMTWKSDWLIKTQIATIICQQILLWSS